MKLIMDINVIGYFEKNGERTIYHLVIMVTLRNTRGSKFSYIWIS